MNSARPIAEAVVTALTGVSRYPRYLKEHTGPNRFERRRMASLIRHAQKRARTARLARAG